MGNRCAVWRRGTAWFALLGALAALGLSAWRNARTLHDLEQRVASRVPADRADISPCAQAAAPALVLLVLGQSNAGNHGAADPLPPGQDRVQVLGPQGCVEAAEPLPGATGRGASVWPRVQREWRHRGHSRPIRFALLAVDATPIAEWTQREGALQQALTTLIHDLHEQGMRPDLVLWQQGEADARKGTPSSAYEAGLHALLTQLRRLGVHAPVLLARSTHCRLGDGTAVRQAQDRLALLLSGVSIGPDLDRLLGAGRVDDCHFSADGLNAAAALWVDALERVTRQP